MTVGSQPIANQSSFLPLTTVYPKDMDELLIRLTKNYTDTANGINIREIAVYETVETQTGQQWNNPGQSTNRRQTFRIIFDVTALNKGNIGAGATVTFAHNISGIKFATNIYASCTSTTPEYFNVVFPNARLNATSLVFTNPLGGTALTQVFLIAESLKQ
jgi:hypothetical protein